MTLISRFLAFLPLVLKGILLAQAFPATALSSNGLQSIRLSEDKRSFVLWPSNKPFRIWGVNYDHDSRNGDSHGRLLEDYWEQEWETVREDFQEIRDLGANVVRIHLQFAKFMNGPDEPNARALQQLRRLLALAEEKELHLDLTGLGCYHKKDVPEWYDALDEAGRWNTQASFWSAIARTCKDSPAVFCYDLMNEPIASGKPEDGWLAGELGGKHFVQRLTLTPGTRSAEDIAHAWVKKLTEAIRKEDPDHLITVGVIPWAHTWTNAKPIFYAPQTAPLLDFVSIHLYPEKGKVDRAIETLKTYQIGKPLLIEETFPLSCSLEEMDEFLRRSRDQVAGHVSFYWGKTIEEYHNDPGDSLVSLLMQSWLIRYQQLAPDMKKSR